MIEIGKKYRLKKLKGWFEKDSEEFTVLTKLDNYHKFKISWDGRKSLLEKQVQELS